MNKLLLTLLGTFVFFNMSYAESLCNASENKLFECGFEKSPKSVSICQSKTNPKDILYRYGTREKIELTLPNEKSKPTFIHYEQFGPSSFQFIQSINFPVGKITYSVSTPQGISASLIIDGTNLPGKLCDTGDDGRQVSDTYDLMKKLRFPEK
jgi:hypothetical protein